MIAIKTQEELFKYDDMIRSFYFKNKKIFSHPAISYDLDDVLQEMRILIIKAIPKYDPTKGMTLQSYIYMHLKDRLISLKTKILGRAKYNAGFYEDLFASSEESNDIDRKLDYLHFKMIGGDPTNQDEISDLLDVKMIIENLRNDDRELFLDRYLYGLSFRELRTEHKKSFTNLNITLRKLDKIFKTLRYQ